MKKILFAALLFLSAVSVFAQAEVTTEGGTKILKGFITKQDLAADPAFPWFAEGAKGYVPEQAALAAFKSAKDSIHILAFGGTWCGDTKALFPKFFALTDAAGISADHMTILGVDRSKKTVHHLAEAFNVTLVPTFIVLKNGKEIGRVVEYGKYGMFDKELGDIVSKK
ncbi:MAG TPA: thioredoxin family protein [Flavisolibacter sp.]|jgi:thiol-disulfide isomerase/thioredoxin|nr:thioredoxin family protein [Flavisolibacter sp.]